MRCAVIVLAVALLAFGAATAEAASIHAPQQSRLTHPILSDLPAYGQTTTSIVQSTPVPVRYLPLPVQRRESGRSR